MLSGGLKSEALLIPGGPKNSTILLLVITLANINRFIKKCCKLNAVFKSERILKIGQHL